MPGERTKVHFLLLDLDSQHLVTSPSQESKQHGRMQRPRTNLPPARRQALPRQSLLDEWSGKKHTCYLMHFTEENKIKPGSTRRIKGSIFPSFLLSFLSDWVFLKGKTTKSRISKPHTSQTFSAR